MKRAFICLLICLAVVLAPTMPINAYATEAFLEKYPVMPDWQNRMGLYLKPIGEFMTKEHAIQVTSTDEDIAQSEEIMSILIQRFSLHDINDLNNGIDFKVFTNGTVTTTTADGVTTTEASAHILLPDEVKGKTIVIRFKGALDGEPDYIQTPPMLFVAEVDSSFNIKLLTDKPLVDLDTAPLSSVAEKMLLFTDCEVPEVNLMGLCAETAVKDQFGVDYLVGFYYGHSYDRKSKMFNEMQTTDIGVYYASTNEPVEFEWGTAVLNNNVDNGDGTTHEEYGIGIWFKDKYTVEGKTLCIKMNDGTNRAYYVYIEENEGDIHIINKTPVTVK